MKFLHLLSAAILLQFYPTDAFAPNKELATHVKPRSVHVPQPKRIQSSNARLHKSNLQMGIPAIINTIQRPKIAACAVAFLLLAVKMIRDPIAFFWPGAGADKKCEASLPDGSMGCPFIGETAQGRMIYMQFWPYLD